MSFNDGMIRDENSKKFAGDYSGFVCYNPQNFQLIHGQTLQSISVRHFRLLFWAFLGFISYKFLTPSQHSGINIPHLDKLAHAGLFFILAWLAHRGYQLNATKQLLWLGIYGALIEVLQATTGYRSGDVLDWLADLLGVVILILLLNCRQKPQLQASSDE